MARRKLPEVWDRPIHGWGQPGYVNHRNRRDDRFKATVRQDRDVETWIIGPTDVQVHTPGRTFIRPIYADINGKREQVGSVVHPYDPLNPADFTMKFWAEFDPILARLSREAAADWARIRSRSMNREAWRASLPFDFTRVSAAAARLRRDIAQAGELVELIAPRDTHAGEPFRL